MLGRRADKTRQQAQLGHSHLCTTKNIPRHTAATEVFLHFLNKHVPEWRRPAGVLGLKPFKNQGFESSPAITELSTPDVFEYFPSMASSLLSVLLLGFASGAASGFVFSDWFSDLHAPFTAPALYSGIAKLSHVCPSSIGAMARISAFAFSTSCESL